MAMGIDRQIQARMALGQDRLQQEYAQTQQLIDLLALQKLSKEKAEAARAVQASMQTNPATVKDQLEQQLMASNKQGIASMMPGIQMQGQRMQQAQARQMAGIPSQSAPNMARMAGGGIVAFQEGGSISNELIYRLNKTAPEGKEYVRTMGLDREGNEIEGLTLKEIDRRDYTLPPSSQTRYVPPDEQLEELLQKLEPKAKIHLCGVISHTIQNTLKRWRTAASLLSKKVVWQTLPYRNTYAYPKN